MVVSRDALAGLRPALRRYAVRLAYAAQKTGAPPLPSNLVEAVLGLLEGGEGTRTLDLPGGVVASGRATGELALYRGARSVDYGWMEISAGESVVFGGWKVTAREAVGYDPMDAAWPKWHIGRRKRAVRGADGAGGGYYPAVGPRR